MRKEIISCRMMPGSLLSEPEVMHRFEIAKASCRVALQRLIHDGLVTSIPRQGYRIAPITLRDVDEVFSLRLLLEPYAARSATGKVNKARLERLEAACRVRGSADIGNQIDFFLEANRSFHMAIVQAAGNERLYRQLGNLHDEMARLVALGFGVQGERPNIERDHVQIIEALVTGDADTAERISRSHIEVFRDMTVNKVISTLRDAPNFALQNLAPFISEERS
ncbi:GntR family transcriptional regulator [Skermanella stibiiresistens SB22]|uniref:GntR family transcriptional regulator n=1 Tax=Skermanella stibiiresistens SB22 TaxID=1385369 RepID=W9H4V5_9PROT|nr:GntR family transcriptional regulator [Skermanella stibiiresistens SB22]